MPSNLINPQMLASEALMSLSDQLVAANLMYVDKTSDFSAVRGYKVGDTVTVRTVTDYRTDEFTSTINPQSVTQSSTSLTIEKHFDTSVEVTAKERALNLDQVRTEVIDPAMVSLAEKIDKYLLTKVTASQGLYTSSTLLTTAADIAQARRQASLQQINAAQRVGLVNDELEAIILGTDAFNRFDSRSTGGVAALEEADLGRLMKIDWFGTVNFPSVTQTTGDGTTTLDNTNFATGENNQGQTDLIVDSTTGTFNAGDKIAITGAKRAYTVASQVTATATTIPLEEQINENLGELDGVIVAVIEPSDTVDYQGIIFNPTAYAWAAPPLDAAAGDLTGIASANGMSVRMTEAYDINTKMTVWSFDMLIGAAAYDARKSMLLGKI